MRRRPSPTIWSVPFLIALLLLSVGVGAAAAFLIPPPGSVPTSTGNPGLVTLVSFRTAGIAILAFTAVWVGLFIVSNASGGGRLLLRPLLMALPAFAITAVIVLVILRAFSSPVPLDLGGPLPPQTGQNCTADQLGCSQPVGGVANNSTTTANSTFSNIFGSSPVPGWIILVGIVGISLIVALVVVALSRMRVPPDTTFPTVSAGPALAHALETLETDANADVRAVIIELYAKLLHRIDPTTRYTVTMSAREIEAESVRFLGIHRETARELTALFEEARYSTHPLPPSAGDRARAALAKALHEYRRTPVAS